MGKHRFRWFHGMTAVVAAVALVFALSIGVAEAGEDEVAIGKPLPDFEMKDTSGKTHKLSDYAGKVVVLQFASHECPWSRGADPDIAKFAKAYKDKDVVVLGINSHYGATAEDIQSYLDKNDLEITVLKDENNAYADKVGAKQTPEVFVVDQKGNLAYHGAWDNRKAPEKTGDEVYVADAVDSLLAGEKVAKSEVSAWGCSIGRAPRAGS